MQNSMNQMVTAALVVLGLVVISAMHLGYTGSIEVQCGSSKCSGAIEGEPFLK